MALACGRGRPIASPAGSSSSQVATLRGMLARSCLRATPGSVAPFVLNTNKARWQTLGYRRRRSGTP